MQNRSISVLFVCKDPLYILRVIWGLVYWTSGKTFGSDYCLPFTISQSKWSESVLCVCVLCECVFENLCVYVHGVRREGVRLLRNKEPKKTLTKNKRKTKQMKLYWKFQVTVEQNPFQRVLLEGNFEGSFGMRSSAVTTSVFRHEWLPRLRLLPKESWMEDVLLWTLDTES